MWREVYAGVHFLMWKAFASLKEEKQIQSLARTFLL